MLRRSTVFLVMGSGFQPLDPDMDPIHSFSEWHYTKPQNMISPEAHNRSMPVPRIKKLANPSKYQTVYIPLEGMHPTFRVALEPYLRKLPIDRHLPSTDAQEAFDDYSTIAPNVGDFDSRMAWLAKAMQLCGTQRKHDLASKLWALEAQRVFETERTAVPKASLVQAFLYSACKARSPDYKRVYELCGRDGWNLTPRFQVLLWSHLLRAAARTEDEDMIVALWREMIDVNVNMDAVPSNTWVFAFNTIRKPENYQFMKDNLFKFSEVKALGIAKLYVTTRSERHVNGITRFEGDFKENETAFYHVMWHSRIRTPMEFNPRRLYFDYVPLTVTSDTTNSSAQTIMEQKINKWKEEGLLPKDYEMKVEIIDPEVQRKKTQREKSWRQLPAFLKPGRKIKGSHDAEKFRDPNDDGKPPVSKA